MKNSISRLAIAALCVTGGCNDDSTISIATVNDENANKPQVCETEGQVKCGDTCIDPQTDRRYCGADANCEHYTTCDASLQECRNGSCEPTTTHPDQPVKCETGEHVYDKICEPDSIDHCGAHGRACSQEIEGWASGKCESGQCVPEQCESHKHLNGNSCEDDSAAHCGSADINCATAIEGWKDGECTDGTCVVSSCTDGYHLTTTNSCEPDPQGCEIAGQVKCGDTCIDPLRSAAYCGADEHCEHYTACSDNYLCSDGACKYDYDSVSANDPSFATDDGIPDGISFRLINKTGKDICFSGKFKPYIKKDGPHNGWNSDGTGSPTTQELECHITPPTSTDDGWPHWHVNDITLANGESKEFSLTEFKEYQGNGSFVQTITIPMDTYTNGEWYFLAEDNVAAGGPSIKLGFAAMENDGVRSNSAYIIHVRPVKASDAMVQKGKKYNLIIYQADTDSKYWYCD